jgi:hypothetical protein
VGVDVEAEAEGDIADVDVDAERRGAADEMEGKVDDDITAIEEDEGGG